MYAFTCVQKTSVFSGVIQCTGLKAVKSFAFSKWISRFLKLVLIKFLMISIDSARV